MKPRNFPGRKYARRLRARERLVSNRPPTNLVGRFPRNIALFELAALDRALVLALSSWPVGRKDLATHPQSTGK